MNYFDRILLFFYSLVVTFILILALPVIIGWWPEPLKILLAAPQQTNTSIVLWTSLALLMLIGLRLAYICIRWQPTTKGKAVVHELKLGELHITLPAMGELVKKAVHSIDGIKEVKSNITPTPDGIDIIIRTTLTPDIKIPETSEQIQANVKDYILETTGITVQNVKVMVDNISANKPRVE